LASLPKAIPLLLLVIAVATTTLLPLEITPTLRLLVKATTLLLAVAPAALGLAKVTTSTATKLILPVAADLLLPVPTTSVLQRAGATTTPAIPPPIPTIASIDPPLVVAVAAFALHQGRRKGASEREWIWRSRESAERKLPAPLYIHFRGWKP
jgi:hypothetical protein